MENVFSQYLQYGGMPAIASLNIDQTKHSAYMHSLYDSVITRDVLERERSRSRRSITHPALLDKLCLFLADNIGNPNSFNNLSEALNLEQYTTTPKTIEAYIGALLDAYVFYPCKRFDIRGKEHLKTKGKYYIVDTGLRNFLLGYRNLDHGRVLENIIYQQLLFDGFEVSVGKIYQKEVDFIAIKGNRKIYIQVSGSMIDPETQRRELAPLRAIGDAYEKLIVVGEGSYPSDIDGIKIIKAVDFLIAGETARPE